mgnify:CR=1 FL=1
MKFESNELRVKWLEVVKSLHNPAMSATNPYFENKYVPLDKLLAYIKPLFLDAGFIIVQEATYSAGVCMVRTEFIHEAGTITSEWIGTENKKDPQGTGSSITYLRRYQLLAICGLVGEADDDGNKGAGKTDEIEDKISSCKSVDEMNKLYKSLDKKQQAKYLNKFTERKGELNEKH